MNTQKRKLETRLLDETAEDKAFNVKLPEEASKDLPVKISTLDEYLQQVETILTETNSSSIYKRSYKATRGRNPREYLVTSTQRITELLDDISTLEDKLKHTSLMESTSGMKRVYFSLRRVLKGKRAYDHMTIEEIILAQVGTMRELTRLLEEQTSVYAALRQDLEAYGKKITLDMTRIRKQERKLQEEYLQLKETYQDGYAQLSNNLPEEDRLMLTSQLSTLERHVRRKKEEVKRVKEAFILHATKKNAVDMTIRMLDGIYTAVDKARLLASDALDYLENMSSVYDTTARMGEYAAKVMNGLNKINNIITQLGELNAKRYSALLHATQMYIENNTYHQVTEIAREPLLEAEQLLRVRDDEADRILQAAVGQLEGSLSNPDDL